MRSSVGLGVKLLEDKLMNFNELKQNIGMIENLTDNSPWEFSDAKVSIVNFQDGANGPLEQKLILRKTIANNEIEISCATISKRITK